MTTASVPNGTKKSGEESSAPRMNAPHHVRKNRKNEKNDIGYRLGSGRLARAARHPEARAEPRTYSIPAPSRTGTTRRSWWQRAALSQDLHVLQRTRECRGLLRLVLL